MSKEYDPWVIAHEMGLTVVERRLRHGRRGEYWHRDRTIALVPRMSYREARSVLTHEVQHAIVGDVPSPFGLITSKQEMRARRATARALINIDEYVAAELIRGPHPASIAHELDVTIHVIHDWITLHAALAAA